MRARTKAVLNRLGIDRNGEDADAAALAESDPRAAVAEVSKAGRRKAFQDRIAAMVDDQDDAE